MTRRPSPRKEPKIKVLILDAAQPIEGEERSAWWDVGRYMDQRRAYLRKMADVVIIRNEAEGTEKLVSDERGPCPHAFPRMIRPEIHDTMLECGFGFA